MLVDVWHIGAPAGSFGSDGRWPKGAAFHGIVYTDACKEDGSVPEIIIQTLWVPESSSFIRKAQGDFFLHLIMWTYGLASQLHTQLGMSWWAFQLSTVERIGIHNFANISSSSTCLGLVQFPHNCVFDVFFSFLQFWGDADLSQIIPTGPLRVVSCCAGVSRRGTT